MDDDSFVRERVRWFVQWGVVLGWVQRCSAPAGSVAFAFAARWSVVSGHPVCRRLLSDLRRRRCPLAPILNPDGWTTPRPRRGEARLGRTCAYRSIASAAAPPASGNQPTSRIGLGPPWGPVRSGPGERLASPAISASSAAGMAPAIERGRRGKRKDYPFFPLNQVNPSRTIPIQRP